MIKTILKLIVKVLESKAIKSGLEEQILKHKNYITIAKAVWNEIDENYRIAEKVEDKLESKAAQFDAKLLDKFPELTGKDVQELRQSIAGEINAGKDAVVDNSTMIKNLQEDNTKLKEEVQTLTDQLKKVQSLITVQA